MANKTLPYVRGPLRRAVLSYLRDRPGSTSEEIAEGLSFNFRRANKQMSVSQVCQRLHNTGWVFRQRGGVGSRGQYIYMLTPKATGEAPVDVTASNVSGEAPVASESNGTTEMAIDFAREHRALDRVNKNLRTTNNRLREEVQLLQSFTDKLKSEIAHLQSEIAHLQSDKASLNEANDLLFVSVGNVQRQHKELFDKHRDLKSAHEVLTRWKADVIEKFPELATPEDAAILKARKCLAVEIEEEMPDMARAILAGERDDQPAMRALRRALRAEQEEA